MRNNQTSYAIKNFGWKGLTGYRISEAYAKLAKTFAAELKKKAK